MASVNQLKLCHYHNLCGSVKYICIKIFGNTEKCSDIEELVQERFITVQVYV